MIEKVVAAQLKDHLKLNQVYGPVQSAYWDYHPTETALLKVHNDILLALVNGRTGALGSICSIRHH